MTFQTINEKLEEINHYLRNTARQLITFNTFDETLEYLLESFYKEYTCDLVGVILNENGKLRPKTWIGEHFSLDQILDLNIANCADNLLKDALWWQKDKQVEIPCDFHNALRSENLSTWFTVPLKNQNKSFGLCVIGFREFVPLMIEAEKIFKEFGHDVANAIELAREKENQKRKIKGIEWMKESVFAGTSIEKIIEKIVERAGRGTQAKGAYVYLYDEKIQGFVLKSPFFGYLNHPEIIKVDFEKSFDYYFQNIETPGGNRLSVPLIVNLKTIGMLHVIKDEGSIFSEEDVEFLKFVSDFVSIQIENARLYKYEYESKKRLETILKHHQELFNKTVKGEDVFTITNTISSMLGTTVVIFDRFMNPITSHFKDEELHLKPAIEKKAMRMKSNSVYQPRSCEFLFEGDRSFFSIWPITGGMEIFGYLVVSKPINKMDRIDRLTLDYILNVYAMEFIKEKLVLETKEQIKESFVNQLFSEKIEDVEKIIQYATITNWNIQKPHRVAVLSIILDKEKENNVVIMEGHRSEIWNQIKQNLSSYYPNMLFSKKGDEYVLIVKGIEEKISYSDYWKVVFERISQIVKRDNTGAKIHVGISNLTKKIEDYYYSYIKAVKAKNVIIDRNPNGGYAFYDDLGPYTILSDIRDELAAEIFVKKTLAPLIQYSEKNSIDLFNTLKVFLGHNGSFREASKELYIHRSTLEYRIERAGEILNLDLNNAEVRFELMMAYKLYRIYNFDPNQLK